MTDKIKIIVDPKSGKRYFCLKAFASFVGLSSFQRVAQNPRAEGVIRRAWEINDIEPTQTSQTLYIDAARLRWLCTNSRCRNQDNVAKVLSQLTEEPKTEFVQNQQDLQPSGKTINFERVTDGNGSEFMKIITENQGVWVKGANVARALGYADTTYPIKHLPEDCKLTFSELFKLFFSAKEHSNYIYVAPHGLQEHTVFVNQKGVDLLILNSTKPEAKKIRDLFFGKVITDLRSEGKCRLTDEEHGILMFGCLEPPTKKLKHLLGTGQE